MVAILALILAAGQAAPAAKVAPAPTSLQQRFDAASDAAAAGKCRDAVTQFEAIEKSGAAQRSGLVAAAIAVRKGRCLIGTDRSDEGEAAVRRGLPVLEAKGESFADDVREGRLGLADAALLRLDFAAAQTEAEQALALSKGAARLRPLMTLARIRMFDHDGQALKLAEEAKTVVTTTPGFSKKDVAIVQTLNARVLLNEGRKKEAYAELRDSLQKQGGLSLKVGLADIGTRSDLAIAALQNGDRDSARNYLAYTGAGRMKDSPFGKAVQMDSPTCGTETGLKSGDVAIVEFSLDDDGHVSAVTPIYTPGDRQVALAFARAVAGWSWRAEDAAKVPALFRYATRVEMRCATTAERPDLVEPLKAAFFDWLHTKGTGDPSWADLPDARALPLQQAAFDRATVANDKPAMLQAAAMLLNNTVLPDDRREALAAQVVNLTKSLQAPVAAQTYAAVAQQQAVQAADVAKTRRASAAARAFRDLRQDARPAYRTLLATPGVGDDALSAATLRLLIAQPGYREAPPSDAKALLDAVIDAPGLPPRHPLKVNAMLQEANVLAATGDLAGARAVFDRTGLTEEQCALIGLTPAVRHSGGSSDDYPMEAVRMGFEGWVKTEFDIAADGKTVAPRAVVAYPPFVFDEAATGIIRDSRYTSSFRPSGALACSGNQQSVVFQLPGS